MPNFAPWTTGTGAAILEALQPELESRWLQLESSKSSIVDPTRMRLLGRSQELVLSAFMDGLVAAKRMDLARFLLAVAARLLATSARAEMWTGALLVSGLRIADRTATYQAATAFLRQLERLQLCERQARTVGYFDEGYAAGQLWKADWDRFDGDALCERARTIVRQLEPMTLQRV
jgi:hypothetical protein